jgi:DHA1 family tetracycline resistance protein-like MFS transporter
MPGFFRSPKFPIFLIVFVDVIGLGITIPVLPVYAEGFFKLSGIEIAGLTSLFFAAQFVGAPILGRLSDRVGRRPVLIASQFGTLTGAILTAVALSPIYLVVARLIDGMTGGNISVAQAYLTDITPPEDRAKSVGLVIAAFGLGFIIGPAFGAFMSAAYGPRLTFACAAAASCCTILLSIFLLKESLPPEKRSSAAKVPERSTRDIISHPQIARILVIGLLGQIAVFAFNSVFILWVDKVVLPRWTIENVQRATGFVFILMGVVTVATQGLVIGPVVRKIGEARAVMVGGFLRLLGNATMAFFPRVFPAIGGSALAGVGGGIAMPSAVALLTFHAPNVARGRIIGINQSAMSLGNIIGPLLGGFVYDRNPAWPPMVSAGALLIMWLVSLGLTQPSKPVAPLKAPFA